MQALKDIALRLINVYVGPYVDNLNEKDLNVSFFRSLPMSPATISTGSPNRSRTDFFKCRPV
jgi:hypothetical protein